jgi:hypothetical protein
MKKFYYKVFVLALIFFIISSIKVFPQDSVKVNSFEDSPIKKGSWAIVFELGAVLWGSNVSGSSQNIEKYNILVKYHIGEKTALRLNITLNGDSKNEYMNNDFNLKSFDILTDVDVQYFLTKKYFAKPFISIGPYYYQHYVKHTYQNSIFSNYNMYNWDVGFIMTFGTEMILYKNISLIAEYIFRGAIGKRNVVSSYDNEPSAERNFVVEKFRANSSRIGVSFYF